MKRLLVVVALLAALGVLLVGPASTASAASTATITFQLSSDGHGNCTLTITSSKDISNYTVNGVKTTPTTAIKTVVLSVVSGDVITVKSGTTTASFTVPAGCGATHP